MTGTRERIVSGLRWTSIAQFGRVASQVMTVVVLGRLLPAEDFGLFAMALVVTGFAGLFRDLGTMAAIIQRRELTPVLLDSIFWLNLAFGLGVAAVLMLASPFISAGFSEPRLSTILVILVGAFPLTALGVVQQGLLERDSRFRLMARIELSAAIAGAIAAIVSAWAGLGAYSLVVQTLVTAGLITAQLWSASEWRPSYRFDQGEVRSLIDFSGNLVGFNVFNYFARNADNLIIGRWLGAADLGYYSMAYKLMLLPMQNVAVVVTRALMPALSRLQEDDARLGEAYLKATVAVVFLAAPLMLGLFVVREPFVRAILGPHWAPVADLLGWLAPVGLFQSVGTTVGVLYQAKGATRLMFRWGVAAGVFVVLGFVIGLQWGLTGVAAAYLVAMLILAYPSLRIPLTLVGLGVGELARRMMPTVLCAVVMAGVVLVASTFLPVAQGPGTVRFIILVWVGIVAYILATAVFNRRLAMTLWHALTPRKASGFAS